MARTGTLPRVLAQTLVSPGGTCYRHCKGAIRTRRLSSDLPGTWSVRACPSGVVSVTTYAEWSRRDPTPWVQRALKRWTVPPSRVRKWDLRLATRRGPELGREAERFLGAVRPARPLRVVYWRVYPFRARDGTERRLFVCLRRSHDSPVFYFASPTDRARICPICQEARARDRKRRG
jgi:hypothetical protein